MATGYGWMSEESEFESKDRQDFSLLHVIQPGSGAHPACYPIVRMVKTAGSEGERLHIHISEFKSA
jgi:hypothetical protein